MKIKAFFAVLAVIAYFPMTLSAQGGDKDQNAAAILSRAVTALGAPLGSARTAIATGSYVQYRPEGKAVAYEVKMVASAPDRIRWETKGLDDTVIIVITGNSGWIQRGGQKRPVSLSDMAGRGFEKFPILALAAWKDAPNMQMNYLGAAANEGAEYQQVRISKLFGFVSVKTAQQLERDTLVDWVFNPESGLPARVRYYENPAKYGQRLPVDLVFSDFRDLGGMIAPMTVTSYINNGIVGVVHFDDVKLNFPVSADDFNKE